MCLLYLVQVEAGNLEELRGSLGLLAVGSPSWAHHASPRICSNVYVLVILIFVAMENGNLNAGL